MRLRRAKREKLTEERVREIARDEIKAGLRQQVISAHAGQRARLMAGVKRP